MKKIIRVLGVTLSLVVLASCSKGDEPDPNAGQTVTTDIATLIGTYKYEAALVQVAVDLDKDGKSSNNLMTEKGQECTWDNVFEFKADNVILTDKGVLCDPTGSAIIFDSKYTLDVATKTLKRYENGIVKETFTDVSIRYDYNGIKHIRFDIYDTYLKQNVTYNFVKI